MPVDIAFAPYRLKPGVLPEEASQLASETASEPLLVGLGDPLPGGMVNRALVEIAAGRATAPDEACRAADGSASEVAGALRPCLSSERQRARVAEAAQRALAAGFAGICLERPDSPLVLGLLGAGFCTECQRAFARELTREYGEQFQPIDYLALAREVLTDSAGAVGFEQLPFGRDFWRMRHDALDRAVASYARAARDAARSAGRLFDVTAQFAALGPAQFRAARHLDAALFPMPLAPGSTGVGLSRLLRAVMGRRPCAAVLPATIEVSPVRLAAIAAACGVEISGLDDAGDGPVPLASVRRLARLAGGPRQTPNTSMPVAECALLYSAESDLWSGGRHREEVQRAGDAFAALHVQAPVVLTSAAAPASATLVLAHAEALSPREAKEVRRRVEAGGSVLVLGNLGAVDELGRRAPAPIPEGKPGGVRVGKGMIAALPALAPAHGTTFVPEPRRLEPLSRSLSALLGKGRRAASVVTRAPLLVILYQSEERLDVHLVTLENRAQGTTLFLGLHVAGGVKRARFQSAEGADEKIVMNPSGYSISTVLPSFEGYAVLSLPA